MFTFNMKKGEGGRNFAFNLIYSNTNLLAHTEQSLASLHTFFFTQMDWNILLL